MSLKLPNESLFRQYDIRGIVGETLHISDAYAIGYSFAKTVAKKDPTGTICIGRDGRLSSPELTQSLARGMVDAGLNVVDIGVGPTPMLYFSTYHLKSTAGIMVTGSHNPPNHNGFKFMLAGKAFFGEEIQALRAHMQEPSFGSIAAKKGEITQQDVSAAYLETLLAAYDGTRELSVVWDAGNGATGDIMKALCGKLAGRHHCLNAKIDGTFPAHHPDPTVPENLEQLIDSIELSGAALGIAFDGDGDRIGVVDDEGEILWGDQLLMLYAADVLKEKPGATIIADVKASGALFDEIKRLGGEPLMWKTGHSFIKSKMAETAAPLAGEMSGHIFFADRYYGYDDALYAAVRMISLVSRSNKKLSSLRKKLPRRINTPELRFECADTRKFVVIEEVKERLLAQGALFSDVDGMRVTTPHGWWLLRASNTQAMLVARCEANDKEGLEKLIAALKAELQKSGVQLPE